MSHKTQYIRFYPYKPNEVRVLFWQADRAIQLEKESSCRTFEGKEFEALAHEFRNIESAFLGFAEFSCTFKESGEMDVLFLDAKHDFYPLDKDVARYKKIWPPLYDLAKVLAKRYIDNL